MFMTCPYNLETKKEDECIMVVYWRILQNFVEDTELIERGFNILKPSNYINGVLEYRYIGRIWNNLDNYMNELSVFLTNI